MEIRRWRFYVEDFDGHGATIDAVGGPDVWLGVTVENQEAADERADRCGQVSRGVSLDGAYHDGNSQLAFRKGDSHVFRCGMRISDFPQGSCSHA